MQGIKAQSTPHLKTFSWTGLCDLRIVTSASRSTTFQQRKPMLSNNQKERWGFQTPVATRSVHWFMKVHVLCHWRQRNARHTVCEEATKTDATICPSGEQDGRKP
jgi:hypothetical protein